MRRLLSSVLAAGVLAAAGCGGDDEENEAVPQDVTVADILTVPPEYTRDRVSTRGVARPVGDLGFVLADDGERIFVNVPPALLETVEPGEDVTVVGDVRQMLATTEQRLRPYDLPNTPTETGDPYINAESVDGADLKPTDDSPM